MSNKTDLSKRSFLRFAAGSAASAAVLQTTASTPAAAQTPLTSPATTPWVQSLPVPNAVGGPAIPAVASGSGCEKALANFNGCTCPTGEPNNATHQALAGCAPMDAYEIDIRTIQHKWHPNLPASEMFGYGGTVPGPTFMAKYGRPFVVRFHNNMTAPTKGNFSIPQTAIHFHNLHSPAESDGYPDDYIPQGTYRDHHYVMYQAGKDTLREVNNTMWYHCHRHDFTSHNVYRGLAGFFLAFDELDSGDEKDSNPKALRLPSGYGKYDLPIVFQDPMFDAQGQLAFDPFNTDGIIGDKFAANGAIQPFLNVERRRYRFRFLVGSVSRVWQLHLSQADPKTDKPVKDIAWTAIANDGNLLPKAVSMPSLLTSPATRHDVVIDFSQFKKGDVLYIENRLEQVNGRGPTGTILPAGSGRVLKIIVGDLPAQPDSSLPVAVGRALRPAPPVPASSAKFTGTRRNFKFDRGNGQWTVNGIPVDLSKPSFTIPKNGGPEIWTLSGSGGWWHPIHIHFEEAIILTRDGKPTPFANEVNARKDVFLLRGSETIEIYYQGFRDFTGHYVMHCHNTVHEDHAMMLRWDIA